MAKSSLDQRIAELVSASDARVLAVWAADCAERVLDHFERAYPDDPRPRSALMACRAWARGEIRVGEARKASLAAHAAARQAEPHPSAQAAAHAAGHAVATAHVPRHARGAAIYAASAVRDAAAPDQAEAAVEAEAAWQYGHLLALLGSS
jgi:hypothetical protein